jgi:hypothetical protein
MAPRLWSDALRGSPERIQLSEDHHETQTSTTEVNTEGPAFTRYLSTEAANTQFRTTLLNSDATKDARVGRRDDQDWICDSICRRAVGHHGPNQRELDQRTRKRHKVGQTSICVVVHRTPTTMTDTHVGKDESIQDIMDENDLRSRRFQIEDIAWLKSWNKPLGQSASLGIWFNSEEAAIRSRRNDAIDCKASKFVGWKRPQKRFELCVRSWSGDSLVGPFLVRLSGTSTEESARSLVAVLRLWIGSSTKSSEFSS